MRKTSTSTQRRKQSVTRDLTARKAGGAKGGIIAVLIGLVRPQPDDPARGAAHDAARLRRSSRRRT